MQEQQANVLLLCNRAVQFAPNSSLFFRARIPEADSGELLPAGSSSDLRTQSALGAFDGLLHGGLLLHAAAFQRSFEPRSGGAFFVSLWGSADVPAAPRSSSGEASGAPP